MRVLDAIEKLNPVAYSKGGGVIIFQHWVKNRKHLQEAISIVREFGYKIGFIDK